MKETVYLLFISGNKNLGSRKSEVLDNTMMLGTMTRGEIILVAIVFAMIYSAGLLPKVVKLLQGGEKSPAPPDPLQKRE